MKNYTKEQLEARISDALEGLLSDAEADELKHDLAGHSELLKDWEMLEKSSSLSVQNLSVPIQNFESATFEANLQKLATLQASNQTAKQAIAQPLIRIAKQTTTETSSQKTAVVRGNHIKASDLYHSVYHLFTRYALAASLTVLVALSLMRIQVGPAVQTASNAQTASEMNGDGRQNTDLYEPGDPRSETAGIETNQIETMHPASSILGIKAGEIDQFLYESDDIQATVYYLALFGSVEFDDEEPSPAGL